MVGTVPPAQALEDVTDGGLHPEGDPCHTGTPVDGQQVAGHVLRVTLDRHLGPRAARDGVEHRHQEVGR